MSINNLDNAMNTNVNISVDSIKKKVLHISHTDIRSDSRILKELEALQKSDSYHVDAIGVISPETSTVSNIHPEIQLESLNLFFNKSKWKPRALRHFFTFLELTLRATRMSIKKSPEVVHCHDTLVLPIGFIVKLFTGAKLVYDAHELESDKNGQTTVLSKATFFIEKLFWNRVDLFVSVSPSILKWYEKKFSKKNNVLVLNSPVLENTAINDNESLQARRYFHEYFNIPDDRMVFLYLGYLSKGRGIEPLLDAFSSNSVYSHVVFMGSGDLSDRITKKSQENNNIHLHPLVKHDQVVKLAKSADVGLCFIERVSLSDYFCLPNKLFEYAFSGISVLASNFPDLSEYVKTYQLGTCSDVDPSSMIKSINFFEENPPGPIKSDLSSLSWTYQEEKLLSAYSDLFI